MSKLTNALIREIRGSYPANRHRGRRVIKAWLREWDYELLELSNGRPWMEVFHKASQTRKEFFSPPPRHAASGSLLRHLEAGLLFHHLLNEGDSAGSEEAWAAYERGLYLSEEDDCRADPDEEDERAD